MKQVIIKISIFLFFYLLTATICVCSEEYKSSHEVPYRPRWEFGLFTGAVWLPHYRGSEEYSFYALPLPYLIYRGEYFQTDKESFKGIFFKSNEIETNFTFYGNPPVESDNNAREGMEDLDAIVEAGPALKWFLGGKDPVENFIIMAGVRGILSVNLRDGLKFGYQGLRGGLNFMYENLDLFKNEKWELYLNLGVDFTDKHYNAYFYNVDEKDVLPEREFYQSSGGYGGAMFSSGFVYRINENFSTGLYLRWDNIKGAVYNDSPLVQTNNNYTIGLGITWKIATSKQFVMP